MLRSPVSPQPVLRELLPKAARTVTSDTPEIWKLWLAALKRFG
ncbi:hypothetical protein [Bradyrhizobium sp. CB3481]|nr:hypothetical protein [Bradyrhizobium sp. CB3481]WFU16279.1 hypothetical protein QA643_35950 [Bradyrhizobium sp. CB3481]